MQLSHGMGYEEYGSKLDNILKVEQQRDKEYAETKEIAERLHQG
ncbi:hypothetical protein [Paenalkalicoccus suaedae]